MEAVYKYPLRKTLSLPFGAEILCVQIQNDEPYIWAKVNPTAATETRKLLVVGTGHSIGYENTRYVGTFQQAGGALVFHVFEII